MAPETLATDLYLGRLIATARRRKGLSQRDLASTTNLGCTLIVDLESGRVSLTTDRRAALVAALGLKPDALDAPGFVQLSPEEQRLVAEARRNGKSRTRMHLLAGRLTARNAEARSC